MREGDFKGMCKKLITKYVWKLHTKMLYLSNVLQYIISRKINVKDLPGMQPIHTRNAERTVQISSSMLFEKTSGF